MNYEQAKGGWDAADYDNIPDSSEMSFQSFQAVQFKMVLMETALQNFRIALQCGHPDPQSVNDGFWG
jgi:hypothetical protein